MNFCGFCGTNLKTGEKSWAAKEPAISSSMGPDTAAAPYSSQQSAPLPASDPVPAPVVSSVPNKSFFDPYSMPVQPASPVVPPVSQQPQSENVNFARVEPQANKPNTAFNQEFPEFQTTMPGPDYFKTYQAVTPPPAQDTQTIVPPPVQETVQPVAPPPIFGSQMQPDQSFFNPVSNEVNEISEQIGSIESIIEAENTDPVSHKYEPVINVPQRNIEIHSDSSENTHTFMQYTRSSKDLSDKDSEDISSRYSSFSFSSDLNANKPAAPVLSKETPAPAVTPEPAAPSQPAEEVKPAAPENIIPSEPAAPVIPEPEPVPEPQVPKETIINFIGQNKSSVESMLRFKGLSPSFVYITDESKYDTVISQSIPGGTEVESGTEISITVSAGTWSDWSENAVPASSMRITETKTQYRRRTRTRTTDKRESNTPSGFEDYNLVDTTYKYSNWVTDQYFTSESVPLDNTCEIVTQSTGFKYAGWFNPSNISAISFSTPDVANFFNSNTEISWMYDETISDENIKPDVKNWRLANDTMTATPAGDSLTSNIFFSAHVINGKAYAMKFGSAETKWYVYRRRTLEETIYHFEKEIISDWSDWSEWTDQEYIANDDCEVQSKTLSRSRRKNSSELDND